MIRIVNLIFSIGILFFINGCKNNGIERPKTVISTYLEVDPSATYQTIAGFGGANNIFNPAPPLTTEDMNTVFGTGENELGFSIFRVRISPNPANWSDIVQVCQEAQSHGAKIIASPWSPPANLKSNNNTTGGSLLPENYEAYAQHLNDFISFMSTNGVDIHAVSLQNEPDIMVSYESCDWTASEMRDFLELNGADITGAQIMAAESFNFNKAFTNTILNDPFSEPEFDIVAGHIYGGGLDFYTNASEKGKEIWMTEYLMNMNSTDMWDQLTEEEIWAETLDMLETIHLSMKFSWNAYVWWYIKRYYSFLGDGNEGTSMGEVLKRGTAFSHFSKFIRPGYVRIGAKFNPIQNIMVSAYKGDNKTIIVIINPNDFILTTIGLKVADTVPEIVTTYTTTVNSDLKKAEITKSEGNIKLTVLAESITTLVMED